jgi:hypothetical protein
MAPNDSVQFAGGVLGRHGHVCAFFNGIDDEYRVLRPYVKDGLAQGDKAFHLVDPILREDHLNRLAEAGVNVQRGMDTGQLEVRPWQDAPLRGGFEFETRVNCVIPKYDDIVIRV